jgi:hypothetical protein
VSSGGQGDITQTGDGGLKIAHSGHGDINVWLRRKSSAYRSVIARAAVLTAIAFLLSADGTPGGVLDDVTGTVALVRQDDGRPALIFPLAGGGIGYCTRSDSRWWLPWKTISAAPRGPAIPESTVFASDYGGFEMLGTGHGTLTYGWRGNSLDHFRWHGPGRVMVHGNPLQGVRGRPGFFEYPVYSPGEIRQFLALVPQRDGGVGLYERVEPGPFDWGRQRLGVIARQLGQIDAITTSRTPAGGIVAVLRAGSRLYEVSHPRGNLPAGFGSGWSKPAELRIQGGGTVSAAGDPALIDAAQSQPRASRLDLAVPVPGGLTLLTTAGNAASPWSIQQLPVRQRVNSVSILAGKVSGRPDTDVVYRSGSDLFSTWKWDGRSWHQPAIVLWGLPQ